MEITKFNEGLHEKTMEKEYKVVCFLIIGEIYFL
jgi:hypothetical protein